MNDLFVIGLVAAGFLLLRKNSKKDGNGGKGGKTPAPAPNLDEKQDDSGSHLDDLEGKYDDLNGEGGYKQDEPSGGGGHGNLDGKFNEYDYLFHRFGELTPYEMQQLGIDNFSINDWKNASDLTTLQHKY